MSPVAVAEDDAGQGGAGGVDHQQPPRELPGRAGRGGPLGHPQVDDVPQGRPDGGPDDERDPRHRDPPTTAPARTASSPATTVTRHVRRRQDLAAGIEQKPGLEGEGGVRRETAQHTGDQERAQPVGPGGDRARGRDHPDGQAAEHVHDEGRPRPLPRLPGADGQCHAIARERARHPADGDDPETLHIPDRTGRTGLDG